MLLEKRRLFKKCAQKTLVKSTPGSNELVPNEMVGEIEVEQVSISSTFTRAFFVRNFGAKAET